jgi:pimeloyl-ACP methyl ester carboxylesterase
MKEEVLVIGKDVAIIGILTTPNKLPENALSDTSKKPMVLLTNPGILHRVGPHRQWVDLARRLGDDGFPVFRFDLTGLGDSDVRPDFRQDEDRIMSDFIEVIDYLEKNQGAKRFVLIGLCSGAIFGHQVAVVDQRVIGTIFIDGLAYRTKTWYIHNFLQHYFNIKRWHNIQIRSLFRKIHDRLFSTSSSISNDPMEYRVKYPPYEKAQTDLELLINREVDMFFIYTSAVITVLNYANQFHDMFPKIDSKNKIQVEFYPEADHTFTLPTHRKRLQESIRCWLNRY